VFFYVPFVILHLYTEYISRSKDVKVKLSCNRHWRPVELPDVEDPTFSRQSAHRWQWAYQPYAPATLDLQKDALVLIFVRGRVNSRVMVRLEGLGKLKRFNDLIGNRTHNIRACSIVPQPSTLPRATCKQEYYIKLIIIVFRLYIDTLCIFRSYRWKWWLLRDLPHLVL
jgi:hypothetical protein